MLNKNALEYISFNMANNIWLMINMIYVQQIHLLLHSKDFNNKQLT